MSKKTVKMPPPTASEEDAREIKHYLVDVNRSFSSFAMEAIKEKIARDRKAKA